MVNLEIRLTEYQENILKMSNQDLLDEFLQMNFDSPEDFTSPDVLEKMRTIVQTECLSRMVQKNEDYSFDQIFMKPRKK